MDRRVVITGLGVVSSLGIGKDSFWESLKKGKSGISKVTRFDTSRFKRHYAGEIKNFRPEKFIPREVSEFFGRASQFAIAATSLALGDAAISPKKIRNRELAAIVGTTLPEGSTIDLSSEKLVGEKLDEITVRLLLSNFAPSIIRNIGHFFKLKGVNLLIPNACAAGNYALGYGFDLIRGGKVDLAVVGGAEAISRITFQGFERLYAMAPMACAPFDKNRRGMLIGEGAGILVLEPLEKAVKREAAIYAEVLGYGLSCDAYHITIPKKEGIKKVMQKALKNSNLSVNEVGYISAHGTGTVQNDKTEAAAIKEVFGQRYKRVQVSSIKSMLGHCMGAASAIEAVTCCLALRDGIIPPTINFKTPDPECDIDCVPNRALRKDLGAVLNNSFAFGGNNCCVAFGKVASSE